MSSHEANHIPPKAFISYSWDNDEHRKWVRELAAKLRKDGVDVLLDQWHALPGDQLAEFMERAIRENDYILIICTQNYKKKSDQRLGGVGYEGDIMTAEVRSKKNHRKFLPILRSGKWLDASPSWLQGKFYIDLSSTERFQKNYQELLLTLFDERPKAPPIGKRKSSKDQKPPIFVGKYSKDYSPPAPAITLNVTSPVASSIASNKRPASILANMIIDTGADTSVIPKDVMQALENEFGIHIPYNIVQVQGITGASELKIYELSIKSQDNSIALDELEFIAADTNDGILGRNFINEYRIMLDSADLTFEIYEK